MRGPSVGEEDLHANAEAVVTALGVDA
jgi:hypothetical protein